MRPIPLRDSLPREQNEGRRAQILASERARFHSTAIWKMGATENGRPHENYLSFEAKFTRRPSSYYCRRRNSGLRLSGPFADFKNS
jgi:hypothetical protein